jgi:predicted dehydrogenase
MAIDLTTEQKELGKENFAQAAEGLTRRGFMKSLAIGAAGVVPASAALYFGYEKWKNGNPVKTALIGAGDEGGVLVGEHNPEFLQFVAVCDLRPSNRKRIFNGDANKTSIRKGFKKIYGADCEKDIKQYDDYDKFITMLTSGEGMHIEAVVIALPLHWHAKAAIDVMRAGQDRGKPIHVLCEKLMAWNITQCKQMIATAKDATAKRPKSSILSIGHQRHYSLLYAHATEVIHSGVLGDIHHIRALWHRNNAWPYVVDLNGPAQAARTQPFYRDGWYPAVLQEDYDALQGKVEKYGYKDVEQLIRWRLYNETGGGLMAELGSHQLDACSIFLGKVHPLSVTGVGGKYFYGPGHNDRDCEDHVFVTFEFPGKTYFADETRKAVKNKDDVVVVTYSSISTNQFEAYGECVMGSGGTMVVEKEESLMLYPEQAPGAKQGARATAVTVSGAGGGKPALEASSSGGGPSVASKSEAGPAGTGGPVSRGYREEMEDFAFCVRLWDGEKGYEKDKAGNYVQRLPRCHGEVAMADAILALSANLAMKTRKRISFEDHKKWFDSAEMNEVPDGDAKPRSQVDVT